MQDRWKLFAQEKCEWVVGDRYTGSIVSAFDGRIFSDDLSPMSPLDCMPLGISWHSFSGTLELCTAVLMTIIVCTDELLPRRCLT